MTPKTITVLCCIATVLLSLGCCKQPTADATIEAPPAPEMPPTWSVTSDISFPAAEVHRVGENLGGELRSLRNTDYEVNGIKLRLNAIEAVDATNADTIMSTLRDLKPEEFLHRRGLIIYEFVGSNDAIPEMQAGKAHLQAG